MYFCNVTADLTASPKQRRSRKKIKRIATEPDVVLCGFRRQSLWFSESQFHSRPSPHEYSPETKWSWRERRRNDRLSPPHTRFKNHTVGFLRVLIKIRCRITMSSLNGTCRRLSGSPCRFKWISNRLPLRSAQKYNGTRRYGFFKRSV